MTDVTERFRARLSEAVKHFWTVRDQQASKQGGESIESKDRGSRGAVTGGKHIDGFIRLVYQLLVKAGLSSAAIYCKARPTGEVQTRKRKRAEGDPPAGTQTELPGWFRPLKDWDLLVIVEKSLVAAIEFKSQVGPSFGNNFNNRTEEALGSATDLWAAYREGAFKPSQRPWLGYFMLLEEAPGSTSPVAVSEPHFGVFPEFRQASYARRYEILLTKLVRERLYDAACFLMATKEGGMRGEYKEPSDELSFTNFMQALLARAMALAATQMKIAPVTPPVVEYVEEQPPRKQGSAPEAPFQAND
jgi:hypothetical protein